MGQTADNSTLTCCGHSLEGVFGGNTVSDRDGSVALSHHEMHLNV